MQKNDRDDGNTSAVTENYDAVNKTCTITFEDVATAINGSAGTSYNMKSSGIIAETFTTD